MFGFGSKLSQEEKMTKLVKKGNWGLLSSYMDKDTETRVNLAKACANSYSSDCMNLLLMLADQPDEEVKFAAIESLSAVGTDHETAELQQILLKTPKENEKLRNAITTAIQDMRHRA